MLYRGVKNVPLPVLCAPKPGRSYLVYPKNHYVVISTVTCNGNCEYGEISDQSKLVFTSPQEKSVIMNHPNGYLTLKEYGIEFLTKYYCFCLMEFIEDISDLLLMICCYCNRLSRLY